MTHLGSTSGARNQVACHLGFLSITVVAVISCCLSPPDQPLDILSGLFRLAPKATIQALIPELSFLINFLWDDSATV